MTLRLLDYADRLIRRCFWRGIPVTANSGVRLSVSGWDADDFVQEALDRLLDGRRAYRPDLTLEQNLQGAIRSLVWSSNKSSRREPLLDSASISEDSDDCDNSLEAADPAPTPDGVAIQNEHIESQKALLRDFEKSLREPELKSLFNALKDDCHAPRDVQARTGIPAARVSELKRKLRRRMDEFVTDRASSTSRGGDK